MRANLWLVECNMFSECLYINYSIVSISAFILILSFMTNCSLKFYQFTYFIKSTTKYQALPGFDKKNKHCTRWAFQRGSRRDIITLIWEQTVINCTNCFRSVKHADMKISLHSSATSWCDKGLLQEKNVGETDGIANRYTTPLVYLFVWLAIYTTHIASELTHTC